ncbi:MAG: hypothetical protein ACR2ML_01860 [Solirubrobacteraceae bacterium]
MHALSLIMLAAEEAEPSKTPFYLLGGLLAAWAVLVSAIGLTRPEFPGSGGAARAVYAISALLMIGAVGSAITTG